MKKRLVGLLGFCFLLIFCLGLVSAHDSYEHYSYYDNDWGYDRPIYLRGRPIELRQGIDYSSGDYVKLTERYFDGGKQKRSISWYEKAEKKRKGYYYGDYELEKNWERSKRDWERNDWGWKRRKKGVRGAYLHKNKFSTEGEVRGCWHVPPKNQLFYIKCP